MPAPDLTTAARELANALEGEVRFGLHDRMLYATDASIYQVEPLGVVIPANTEDAVRAIQACHRLNLPILPRGGGTSLAGQCTNRAVVMDLSAGCAHLLSVDAANRRCKVEPGITIDDLNDRLKPTGLFFPPDPATARHANVGGCIGNNAAGSRSIKYGRTSESLIGVDVALSDGRRVTLNQGAALRDPIAAALTEQVAHIVRPIAPIIRERFPKTVRRNAGYALDTFLAQLDAGGGGYEQVNLAHLVCGSEGTLAVTLGAELALHPIPKARGLAVVAFGTLDAAIEATLPLLELGPSAVELLDDLIVGLARENLEYRRYVDLLPNPTGGARVEAVLYVEFSEETPDAVAAKFARVRAMFAPSAVECHTDVRAMGNAWKLRKAGEPLLHAIPGHRKPLGFVEDNAVPPARLAEFVRRFRAIIEREGTRASFYAHASVGVLHVRPLLDLRDAGDRAAMERIATGAADLARELGGVMSGEHGDGKARGPFLERMYGPEIMAAFRAVKALFDPANLLNPGNIVEPGPIDSIHARTRVQPLGRDVHVEPVETFFDYSDQGDFAHAVEMCNGAGVCRKKTGGVMCPSYMATLDERHSTRGRGNALRLAISGQLGIQASRHQGMEASSGRESGPLWDDAETKATLDLCLSCKACKSECPSNVDVARLKAEYTAQGYRATGRVPLRAMVFGHIHELNLAASVMPSVVNFVNGFGPTRAVADWALGLARERSLPRFERSLRKRWGEDERGGETGGTPGPTVDAPVVALYCDTFTTHNEPSLGLAARRVLEAFGYRVRPVWGTDAARAMISVGLLPQAIRRVDREVESLRWLVEGEEATRPEALLFVEPSCLSAVVDDWVQLRCSTSVELRRAIAAKSFAVESFLDARWESHPRRPTFAGVASHLVLHGHCHAKALGFAGGTASMLERVAPGRVKVLDTTCCGMAGSFGYTRERFGLSMRIGELGVLPAARGLAEGDVLVAAGTSCRHQVKDGVKEGAGKVARHPVEVLAGVLG